jgi:hypothetical protein
MSVIKNTMRREILKNLAVTVPELWEIVSGFQQRGKCSIKR